HVPAAEIDHACTQFAVRGVEYGLLRHVGFAAMKMGTGIIRFPACRGVGLSGQFLVSSCRGVRDNFWRRVSAPGDRRPPEIVPDTLAPAPPSSPVRYGYATPGSTGYAGAASSAAAQMPASSSRRRSEPRGPTSCKIGRAHV